MHSRQARHEKQLNELKAAASSTPGRRISIANLDDMESATPASLPRTPRGSRVQRLRDDGDDDIVVSGAAVTPMKRVPILANFEEWMKMATDNKINATNSWNFALIDYFHDMSLLKEGDGVNFQKASCTLDGCVKIYTSRVDSVATETGKLLSGLADSNNRKKDKDDADGDGEGEESEEEVDEDGNVRRKSKRKVGLCFSSLFFLCLTDVDTCFQEPVSLTGRYWVPTGATVFRSHSSSFIRLIAAQEIRVGIRRRPPLQESIGRL